MIETIESLHYTLLFGSPLWYFLALLISYIVSIGSEDSEVKVKIFKAALIMSLLLGFLGFAEIRPGGWNLQYLAAPFFMLQWAFIVFACFWPILFITSIKPNMQKFSTYFVAGIIALMGISGLSLVIAEYKYVKKTYQDDSMFWKTVLDKDDASLPLTTYKDHLSKEGRLAISNHLHYDGKNGQMPKLSTKTLLLLVDLGFDIADHPNIDHNLISKIGITANAAILARNPGTPKDILEQISNIDQPRIFREIALNPKASPALLEKILLKSEAWLDENRYPEMKANSSDIKETIKFAKMNLASNPLTPEIRVRKLAQTSDLDIKQKAVLNINVPIDVLIRLANDADGAIKFNAFCALGKSSKTPKDLFMELSGNGDDRVRGAVASNPYAPRAALMQLLNDKEYSVWSQALNNLLHQKKPPFNDLKISDDSIVKISRDKQNSLRNVLIAKNLIETGMKKQGQLQIHKVVYKDANFIITIQELKDDELIFRVRYHNLSKVYPGVIEGNGYVGVFAVNHMYPGAPEPVSLYKRISGNDDGEVVVRNNLSKSSEPFFVTDTIRLKLILDVLNKNRTQLFSKDIPFLKKWAKSDRIEYE